MSDLLSDARELRQKLHRLEVLLEIEKGPRARSWFEGRATRKSEGNLSLNETAAPSAGVRNWARSRLRNSA